MHTHRGRYTRSRLWIIDNKQISNCQPNNNHHFQIHFKYVAPCVSIASNSHSAEDGGEGKAREYQRSLHKHHTAIRYGKMLSQSLFT